jgi:hypothetical protein
VRFRHAIVAAATLGLMAASVAVTGTATATTPTRPTAPTLGSGSGYTAMSPQRVLDTREGLGGKRRGPDTTLKLDLSGVVPVGTTAVVFNLTAFDESGIFTTSPTYITVWPDGTTRPATSTINIDHDQGPCANLVTVAVGPNRTVDLYNHVEFVSLVADMAGYYAPGNGAGYTTLTPSDRVLDSRNGVGTTATPFTANSTRTLDLSGQVPAGTTAVTFNLTATNATSDSYVTVWPATGPRPTTSNLNMQTYPTVANLVTVAVSPDRKVNLFNLAGSVDLIADLAGYYVPGVGSAFTPLSPQRILDTRNGIGGQPTPFGPGAIRPLDLSGLTPEGATAVVLNLTGVDATWETYFTVWPDRTQQPVTTNLNVVPWQTTANSATVALPTNRTVDIYNNAGSVDLLTDIAGYFAPNS